MKNVMKNIGAIAFRGVCFVAKAAIILYVGAVLIGVAAEFFSNTTIMLGMF